VSSLERLSANALAPVPGEPETVGAIRAGQVFTVLLDPEPARRASRIETVIDNVADFGTRVVRVGNPLRAPLTIERILIQAAGPEADARVERDPALLASLLARPEADESRRLIVVEQPDTIDAESLSLLHAMAPHLAAGRPSVQVLFGGPPGFAAALEAARPSPARKRPLAPILLATALLALLAGGLIVWRHPPRPGAHGVPPALVPSVTEGSQPATPAPAPPSVVESQPAEPAAPIVPEAAESEPAKPAPPIAPAAAESQPAEPATTAAPTAAESEPARSPAPTLTARAEQQPIAPPPPPASVAAPPPAPAPAAPKASVAPLPPESAGVLPPNEARLRREFDSFLANAGQSAAHLGETERAALFQEFLAWRRTRGSAEHDQAGQAGGQHRDQVR